MDDPSHTVLYLYTGTLTQNEVGTLLKWGRSKTGKNSKFGKTCTGTERVFSKVVYHFSVFEHPCPSKIKFLPCSEHVLGPLYLNILQRY